HIRRDRDFHARGIGTWNRAAVSHLAQSIARREQACRNGRIEVMSAPVADGLCKSFAGLRLPPKFIFLVKPAEDAWISGPNGAGKTTLFNLITGELTPDSGSIRLFDRDITRTPSRRRPHLGMARTYQIITLFARDTILRNVTLALLGLSPLRWNPFIRIEGQ